MFYFANILCFISYFANILCFMFYVLYNNIIKIVFSYCIINDNKI